MASHNEFLLCYPVFLIGQDAPDANRPQQFAITSADGLPALMVFTEELFAERMMIGEKFTGFVVPVGNPAALANLIHRYRHHFQIVLIDGNAATGIGRGFKVDEFLTGLES